MRACIHRGARQIGGSLVELEANGRRLVLDAGLPLDLDAVPGRDLLPDVSGLWTEGDGTLEALLISHGHPDHHGLADLVAPSVPIYMGEAAAAILSEAAFFVPSATAPAVTGTLRHRRPLRLGPFTVTPWLVDHSGFDAYALLVEAGERRLLYTGDIRAHGRKAGTLDALSAGAGPVNVLLMEGTRLGDKADGRSPMSEDDVERACADLFRATSGMALAFFSPQNVDRMVTLYRAAKAAKRIFVMDLYAASIAAATGHTSIPQAEWQKVRVFLPAAQRTRAIAGDALWRIDAVHGRRIYREELVAAPERVVMICRPPILDELVRFGCLDGAGAVWSMWSGYLDLPRTRSLRDALARLGIPLTVIHASGHATPADLRRFAERLDPGRVVPIHTAAPERFAALFPRVAAQPDGSWWHV